MPTVAAMIPVLLGSTRVPNKNILLVDGRVLCSYTIEACRASGVFSEICLNSEDDVFRGIAETEKVRFDKRLPENGGRACRQATKGRVCNGQRCVTNEHYLYDFMKRATSVDYVCQVNATSPLLKGETIKAFVNELAKGDDNSFFAVTQTRAESYIENKPITFNPVKKGPSQEIVPIDSVCWAIAGWNRKAFIDAYERDDPEEDGPAFVAPVGLMPIDEREALDIDEWSTLEVVEHYLVARRTHARREWQYIDGRTIVGK